jgi:hypothetical protein
LTQGQGWPQAAELAKNRRTRPQRRSAGVGIDKSIL